MTERVITSLASGQVFIFSDAWNTPEGRVRQLKYTLNPGKSVAPHIHPNSSQFFRVINGELSVRADGKKIKLLPGDEVKSSHNGEHAQWNDGREPVVVIEGYEPPIDIEPFFTVLPHAIESKNLLKIFVFLSDFDFVVTSRWRFAKNITKFIGFLGKLSGYKKWYLPHIQHLKCPDLISEK